MTQALPVLAAALIAGGVWWRPSLRHGLGRTAPAGQRIRWPSRARADARAAEAAVVDTCEALAGELRAGVSPEAALARVAADWPVIAPVARAIELGADVPAAWRVLARLPGCTDLELVAAAWQVSHQSGGALARAMGAVAGRLRRLQSSRRIVASELASARATARLMAGLPLLGWAMGSGIGGDPLRFLFGSAWGLGCLGFGVALNLLGLWWINRIADSIEASR